MSNRPKHTHHSGPFPLIGTSEAPANPIGTIEPLLSVDDLARVLNGSRRTVERMRAAGKLPRPDLHIGKCPRWKPETIRQWIEGGGK